MTGHEYAHFWGTDFIYEYDSTEDGPECEIITRILANHVAYTPGVEKGVIERHRSLEIASHAIYSKPFPKLTVYEEATVRNAVSRYYMRHGECV